MKTEGGTKYTFRPIALKRDFPVFMGLPGDDTLYTRWVSRFAVLPRHPQDVFMVVEGTYVTEARNEIHRAFVEECPKEIEWLVMLDTDVMPPATFVDQLAARNKKFIGGWYRNKTTGTPCVYNQFRVEENGHVQWVARLRPGEKGWEKVDGIGFGCILMHRDVAEMLGPHPYNQHISGEDLEMCYKLRKEYGQELFVDWEVACDHVGMFIYKGKT